MKIFGIFLVTAINIYYWILFIRLIIPLLKLPQYSMVIYLYKITDPFLNFFKKHFPIKINNIDFSPFLPLILLFIIQIPLRDFLISQVHFSGWYLIGFIFRVLDIVTSSLSFMLVVAGIALLFINITNTYTEHPLFYLFKSLFDIIINPVTKLIKIKNSDASYRIYLIISIVIVAIIGIILHVFFMSLYGYAIKSQADNLLYKQIMEQ